MEKIVHELGPESIQDVPLITMDELRFIRQIWLDEKHEFDDSLPRIYEEVTGKQYHDGMISKNKYFGAAEMALLQEICQEKYKDETLLAELQCALLDTEAKAAAISNKRNVIRNLENEIKKAYYRDEDDAAYIMASRKHKIQESTPMTDEDQFLE